MMGLLNSQDWHDARWIGQEVNALMLDQSRWIWTAETDPSLKAPSGIRYFQRTVLLPADRKIKLAVCEITADRSFDFYVNGKKAASGGGQASFSEITKLLNPGKNVLSVEITRDEKSPNPAGLIGALRVDFESGESINIVSDSSWESSSARPAEWPLEKMNSAAWASAKVLGNYGDEPWKKRIVRATESNHPPLRSHCQQLETGGGHLDDGYSHSAQHDSYGFCRSQGGFSCYRV